MAPESSPIANENRTTRTEQNFTSLGGRLIVTERYSIGTESTTIETQGKKRISGKKYTGGSQ
jgi:hypothetical protein